jgi:23S rRNA U2552 (ribose-2'-O)-methylase RlmE/FtsJ
MKIKVMQTTLNRLEKNTVKEIFRNVKFKKIEAKRKELKSLMS